MKIHEEIKIATFLPKRSDIAPKIVLSFYLVPLCLMWVIR